MKRNKIVVFKGGLGNQLFQYVFYTYLQHKGFNVRYLNKAKNSHNGLEVNKYFQTNMKAVSFYIDLLLRICYKFRLTVLQHFRADDIGFNINKIIFDGYWHNQAFYVQDLKFKKLNLNAKNANVFDLITKTNSVSIHVRRGDYLTPKNIEIFGGICTLEYYKQAIEEIKKRLSNPNFFIFSNDIEWCEENFKELQPTYISWNAGNDSIYDMYLMSCCKANIIANSSFSYWGARLGTNNIVVYPNKWFNNQPTPDIFDESWISIDVL